MKEENTLLLAEKNEIMVTTVDGSKCKKKECRKIKGEYWKIGDVSIKDSGHCYKINDKYYKYNTGYIIYDHRLQKYVIKNTMILVNNGVVGIDENEKPIFGSFSKNPDYNYDTFLYVDGSKYLILSDDIFNNSKLYIESIRDGNFYKRDQIETEYLITPSFCNNSYKSSLNYDSRKGLKNYSEKYNKLYDNEINKAIKKYGNFIKDFTFGIEFETIKGYLPNRISDKLGLIPLRDGSIQGLEYATVPLSGKKGLQTIIDICGEMKKRTTYNNDCALHIHLGGIPRTEEFFLALFKVLIAIEDEFYSMFPIYTKYNYGIKRKHYTKKFPISETVLLMDSVIDSKNIKYNFDKLFKFLSSNLNYSNYEYNLNNVKYHPSDPEGNSKWNIKSR